MLRTKLFDGEPTAAQQAIISLWFINIGGVLLLWATTTDFFPTWGSWLDAIGMLLGLLATYFALTQFMLMGRIAWIERQFGLDHLASYHRLNGYLAFTFILLHPIFITTSYAIDAHRNLAVEFADIVLHYSYVWMALIAELLFIGVVATTIYIVRKRLKFESWYFVHLMVYLAIVLVPFHQLTVGMSFASGHPLATTYWLGLYGFAALNLAIWRFGLPVFNYFRFGWRIDRLVAETPTTTSVYIRGRKLRRFKSRPGQFILVRIFAKGFWWQEHPFSLSWIPHEDLLRLTIRHVGDYTSAIAGLTAGKRVLVSGPYGRFTGEIRRGKGELFIAGGVGITPIRSLTEQLVSKQRPATLLYANRSPDDIVLADELAAIQGLRVVPVYSDPPIGYRGHVGYIDEKLVSSEIPDAKQRDIYLCGPPPMMEGLLQQFIDAGFDPNLIHYERFALHN
jgi:predicted ferric reductase